MSIEANAPVAEVSLALPADAPAEMNVSDAARLLSLSRRPKQEAPSPSELNEAARASMAQQRSSDDEPELAQEADAAPLQEEPGANETQEAEPADLPPIEPPRSWTKEEKEAFQSWPREAQESIARVASTRETEFRRSQNEATEAKKAFEARLAEADRIRKDYEAKLPALSKTLEAALQNEFADIQTFADLRKMQTEDPFRYQQWDLRQKELAAAKQEETAAQERQNSERSGKRSAYEQEQTKRLIELAPEIADQKKAVTLREGAVKLLTDDRFTMDQLQRWMADDTGHEILSHAAFQKMVLDVMQFEDAKKAPARAIPKPVPPVQRPGVAKGGNPSATQQIQALEQQLSKASGTQAIRLAAQLTALKRSPAR